MLKNIPKRCRTFFRLVVRTFSFKSNVLPRVATVTWGIVMLVLLFLPGEMIPLHMAHNEDKLLHFGGFSVLSGLGVLCIRNFRRIFFMTQSSFVMAVGSGCSILTELLQQGVSGRTTSFMDGLANIAGVLAGIIVTNLVIFCLNGHSKATLRSGGRTKCSSDKGCPRAPGSL